LSHSLFWTRDKLSNRVFMFDPGGCVSISPATPHLIQRARMSDRKLTAAGGFELKSYEVVEETMDIGFGPKAWIFYVVETHNPLLSKDFFQHNFLTWKYVRDDGSRTIKLRVTDKTTGNSIMVTDDHIGCNAVSSEFPSVTEDIHFNQPCKHPFEHHIPIKGRPCFARARKVAPKYTNLARQKINEMLASGVLERASGPYASPMHIVPNYAGKDIRIVGDYRALNISIVKDVPNSTILTISRQNERCENLFNSRSQVWVSPHSACAR